MSYIIGQTHNEKYTFKILFKFIEMLKYQRRAGVEEVSQWRRWKKVKQENGEGLYFFQK